MGENTKKEDSILSHSIAKVLLMPSAELLGEELKNEIQQLIDHRRAKKRDEQQRNLKKHLELLANKIAEQKIELNQAYEIAEEKLILKNLACLPEWVEGAQEIDPDAEETKVISTLWQELLLGMSNGYDVEGLISTLKRLRAPEALLLIGLSKNRKRYIPLKKDIKKDTAFNEFFYVHELEKFELVEHPKWYHLLCYWSFLWRFLWWFFVCSIGLIFLIWVVFYFFPNNDIPPVKNDKNIDTVFFIFMISLCLTAITSWIKKIRDNVWMLSPKGISLVNYSIVDNSN